MRFRFNTLVAELATANPGSVDIVIFILSFYSNYKAMLLCRRIKGVQPVARHLSFLLLNSIALALMNVYPRIRIGKNPIGIEFPDPGMLKPQTKSGIAFPYIRGPCKSFRRFIRA